MEITIVVLICERHTCSTGARQTQNAIPRPSQVLFPRPIVENRVGDPSHNVLRVSDAGDIFVVTPSCDSNTGTQLRSALLWGHYSEYTISDTGTARPNEQDGRTVRSSKNAPCVSGRD